MGLLRLSGRRAVGLVLRASPRSVALSGLVVLLAAALVVWLAPSQERSVAATLTSETSQPASPSPEPTTTEAEEAEPSPTPTPQPRTAQTTPPPVTTAEAPPYEPEPTTTASPTPSLHGDPPCAFDGSGCHRVVFAGCDQATRENVPSEIPTTEVAYGVIASFRPESDRVLSGQALDAELQLENTGARTVTMELHLGGAPRQAFLVGEPGGSARHWSDVIELQRVELDPGETWSTALTVRATRCAPSDGEPEPPLAPGEYTGGGNWYFGNAEVENATPLEPKESGEFAVGTPIEVL